MPLEAGRPDVSRTGGIERARTAIRSTLFAPLFGLFLWAGSALAADVATYHYDNARTGWAQAEKILTPGALRSGEFEQLVTVPLDNQVDAQPLFIANVSMGGKIRDVLYAFTEGDTVYALDANTGAILLQRNLGTPVEAGKGKPIDCGNNASEIGIASTPVIDRASETIYVVGFFWEGNLPVYRIFALDLLTLADKTPSQIIRSSVKLDDGEDVTFDAVVSRQRPALTFANDKIYAEFGSFCDHGADRSRGLIVSFDSKSLMATSPGEIMDRRPNQQATYHLASIWMSGAGPAVDATGDLYFITGNSRQGGSFGRPPPTSSPYFAESVIRTPSNLTSVLDYFTPHNYRLLDLTDKDFGSGGVLLPFDATSPSTKLVVAAGKDGKMFLLDRGKLGKLSVTTGDDVLDTVDIGKCWCTQSFYVGPDGVGRVLSSGGAMLSSWKIATAPKPKFVKEWDGQSSLGSNVFQKGFFTSISSDGTKPDTAVVWAVQRPAALPAILTLWAFDAKTGTAIVALPAGRWPNLGGSANTVPVVANGHVIVASFKELKIFGLAHPVVGEIPNAVPEVLTAAESEASVFGRILSVNGNIIKLKTNQVDMEVDASDALAQHKSVTLTEGVAIKIFGSRSQNNKVSADSIEYAPDNPAFWKATPRK